MVARLLPIACILMGVLMIALWLREEGRAVASSNWPQAVGKIVASQVVQGTGSSRQRGKIYQPRITYEFTVAGRTRSGERVSFLEGWSGNRGQAGVVVARYPIGKEVVVRYDPADPDRAVLETTTGSVAVALLLIGVLFAGIGVVMLAFTARRRLRRLL